MEQVIVIEPEKTNEQLLKLILDEDELSWQSIIHDLVRSDQMDPWDIDVSVITKRFLDVIKTLQQLDFRVSGKMVLASAMLLKIKSNQLMSADFEALESLIHSVDEPEYFDDMFGFDADFFVEDTEPVKQPKIYPRTPQPRQRKVSVFDLVDALEAALDVRVRREQRSLDRVKTSAPVVEVPAQKIDVSQLMNDLLQRIDSHDREELFFHHLAEDERFSKVLTFIPLLHLTNERRVDIEQQHHFGPISVTLLDNTPVNYQEASVQ